MRTESVTAIVLAGGQGKRMKSETQKQYLMVGGRPLISYALDVFQLTNIIDEIILVVGEGQEQSCKKEIVEKYGYTKVTKIVIGGKERYHSVYNGICAAKREGVVFIHDGARPFINEQLLSKLYNEVKEHRACISAVRSKDTIKIADDNEMVKETPDREYLWSIQTPQVFETELIVSAYEKLFQNLPKNITDDAMVVENTMNIKVKLVEGEYQNIKITTPEDLEIAEVFAKKIRKKKENEK